jgi:hypothetical protein
MRRTSMIIITRLSIIKNFVSSESPTARHRFSGLDLKGPYPKARSVLGLASWLRAAEGDKAAYDPVLGRVGTCCRRACCGYVLLLPPGPRLNGQLIMFTICVRINVWTY